ncbi:MAG: SAM-dependent methyltransferase [Hormoscilla sp.]
MVYDLSSYGAMIVDQSRDLYVQSLLDRVHPGDRVLDLGSGTGYFSLIALKQGAKKVYAIEPDEEALKWIDPCAAENKVAPGTLTAICKDIKRVTLEDLDNEKVDVIVWDTRGTIPHNLSVETVISARRFLKPDGSIIAKKDFLYLALVEDSSFWDKLASPWVNGGVREVNLTSCRNACLDRFYQCSLEGRHLLSKPVLFQEIDYATVEPGYEFKGSMTLEVEKKALLHGFALWFNSEIDDGLFLSNEPGAKGSRLYNQMFFTLREPCFVSKGYKVNLNINTSLFESEKGIMARVIRNGSIVDTDSRLVMTFDQDG